MKKNLHKNKNYKFKLVIKIIDVLNSLFFPYNLSVSVNTNCQKILEIILKNLIFL